MRYSCVPLPTTLPSSIITMRSQSRTELSRWAIISTVMPRARSAFMKLRSASASSALVASSSRRMLGLWASERAISRRWAWPPLKLVPPSFTIDE